MNTSSDLHNHIIFTTAKDIADICKPLFNSFNTTYFNFVRRYEDNSEVCLTTNPKWSEFFYLNKLYKYVLADRFAKTKSIVNKLQIISWAQFSNSQVRATQSKLFNIGIGISLIIRRRDHIDFFHYGTDNRNHHMNELYISYADCLIQFIHYFYDAAYKILKQATLPTNRLVLPDRPLFRDDNEFPLVPNFNVPYFLSETQPKRFAVYKSDKEILLSKKEILCINLLTKGKTAYEIGLALHMSKRTVETHLKNARIKLGLVSGTNKADLIYELYNNGFNLHDLLLN